MHALFSLHQDHRVLLELTDALDVFAHELTRSEALGAAAIGAFARAFRDFADNIHYEKEEQVLLPFITRHGGFDHNDELLEQVRDDHCQERYLIDVLSHAAEQETELGWADRRRLARTATALAGMQRNLLMRQDVELFPAVSCSLERQALEQLFGDLSEFDFYRSERTRELKELIGELARRYPSVPPAARS